MVDQNKAEAGGSKLSARLVAADGTVHELSAEQTLGRSADDDITINESNISRGHARLRLAGEQLTVEDLGSTNGTRINSKRIKDVAVLQAGDVLSFDTIAFRVELTGAAGGGATKAGSTVDDATVIGSPPVHEQEKSPESPTTRSDKPKPPPFTAPASWDDKDDGSGTVVMYKAQKNQDSAPPLILEHSSDLPHLIMVIGSEPPQVLELETSGDGSDVWEIGRDERCTIVVADDSVSATHAQLIHENGSWRLVNLVSTNGIYVNGEKRLTAVLADGYEIKLGMARLIFKSGGGGKKKTVSGAFKASGDGSGSKLTKPLLIGLGVVVIAIVIWLLSQQ